MFLALKRYDTMRSGRYHVIIMRPSISLSFVDKYYCIVIIIIIIIIIYNMYHRCIAFQEDAQTCFQDVSSMVFYP